MKGPDLDDEPDELELKCWVCKADLIMINDNTSGCWACPDEECDSHEGQPLGEDKV